MAGDLSVLRDAAFDAERLAGELDAFIGALTFNTEHKRQMRHAATTLTSILQDTPSVTLQVDRPPFEGSLGARRG